MVKYWIYSLLGRKFKEPRDKGYDYVLEPPAMGDLKSRVSAVVLGTSNSPQRAVFIF